MPKRTDADWLALDKRIAEQVMGWQSGQAPRSLQLIDKASPGSEACDLYQVVYPPWQPHEDVAQALEALDAVVKKGFDADLQSNHYGLEHELWIRPAVCRGPCWLGVHERRAKSICLAIEQWMNAHAWQIASGWTKED